jgi:hypothetical protein
MVYRSETDAHMVLRLASPAAASQQRRSPRETSSGLHSPRLELASTAF